MTAKRVLQVFSSLDRGGAEQIVMTWYRNLDRERVQFDFVVEDHGKEYIHEEEIENLGGRVFRVPSPARGFFQYIKAWSNLLKEHPEWEIIHGHHTSPAAIYLSIARINGLKTIAHSHTSGGSPTFKGRAKRVVRFPIRYIAHLRLACSVSAGKWMFGARSGFCVIPNAIETSTFRFTMANRTKIREELELGESLVVGHVGNFSSAKNYPRTLRIFRELLGREPDSRLLLVGDGLLRAEVERAIQIMGLEDRVTLVGSRSDVPSLMAAMDVLILPSHFEGLPTVVIEAQASGLRCVISDAITSEVILSELVIPVSLLEPDTDWAEHLRLTANQGDRSSAYLEVVKGGYDIENVLSSMLSHYAVAHNV